MIRVRFAPSPTGFVHVGNARTALFNYLYAKHNRGAFVLRIEDTDIERSKKEFETNLIKDLNWLGIEWDEGPDKGGEYKPYRQSERIEIYKKFALELIERGNAYYCFCTPEELEQEKQKAIKEGRPPGYSGKCRNLDINESKKRVKNGEPAAIRFKIPKDTQIKFKDIVRGDMEFDSNLLSDPVILRSNGMPAYNFSVVIDDSLMKITHVIRGEDHLSNTARQVLIYKALGFEVPIFAHLSMVMGEDNTKLSKRHGSTSLIEFKENGYLPEALFNYLALLGWSSGDDREIFTRKELIKEFNLNRVSKSAAIFDYKKLQWLNREHIRKLDDLTLGKKVFEFLKKEFEIEENNENFKWIGKTSKILSDYNHLLTEISKEFKQFFRLDKNNELIKELKNSNDSLIVLKSFYKKLQSEDSPINMNKIGSILKEVQNETGFKGKALYHPIRIALTGKEKGIEIQEFINIIEQGSILNINPNVLNIKKRIEIVLSI